MRTPKRRARSRIARAAAGALGGLLVSLALTAPAQAEFAIDRFSAQMLDVDPATLAQTEVTQAGAHPDLFVVDFAFTTRSNARGGPIPYENPKDVQVELPAGVYGNPQATPRCSMVDYGRESCSDQTIVGSNDATYTVAGRPNTFTYTAPVYNVTPPEGVVARFAFRILAIDVILDMKINSDGRYTLQTDIRNLSQATAVVADRMTLFGIPADLNGGRGGGVPGGGPRIPLLTVGAQCGPPQPAVMRATSWDHPDTWVGASYTPQQGISGCEATAFSAGMTLQPQSPRSGVPSAYDIRLQVPQSDAPDALATPPVRRVVSTLPEGVVVSPSSVQGLTGCTDEQAALRSLADPVCPDASRIGSVRIDTPLLSEPLTGGVFLGQPLSMRSQSGEMLRIFLIATAQGVTIKQEGRITPDPVTGQLTAVFEPTPQLPFAELAIDFNGGPTAPLTNPRQCGTHTTTTAVTAWSGQTVTSQDSFATTQDANGNACAPLGFAPAFVAGMGNASAGASSTFTLGFGRDDTQQDLGDLSVNLPAGMMGMVASSELCDDAAAAAGTCADSSRIGSVKTAVGAGANPFQLSGRGVYLTGPYKGGAFGLSIVVPAVAGPFDLGTVVVRAAVHVDRKTAALSIVSDPFPTILEGIPLRMRQVTVAIDKPGFMVNPTSCSEKRIGGVLRSSTGTAANVGSRFQAGNCRALPFAPKLALQVGSRGRTGRGVTTPLTARLTMTPGQANNRAVTVKLPKSLNSRLEVIRDACTLEQFEAGTCDKNVGTASATTPVLRNPLTGTLQFVRNPARRLPDLMVRLRGAGREAGVVIDLTSKVTIPRDLSLQTSFDTIPDVPISSFRLSLVSGRRGAIGITRNLCEATTRRNLISDVSFRAQSGVLKQAGQRVQVAGCGARAAPKPKPKAKGTAKKKR
ncbi:MAG TPA: hypothetical protein VLK58_02305 [Conexibacter sp.]|nr:hypothetical protein [Conexibacter sp.]